MDEKIVKDAFSTAFKNLITDHKSVTVRIPHIGNEFSEEFKSKFYFDADHHLKENKKKNTARRMDDKTGDFELSSLDSPNWISDEAIDNYFELIKSKFTKFFAFSTGFFACLKKEGYDGVKEWYREISIFKYKKIFFPIYDKGHHYLVVFDNSNHKIEAYDPFDFQSYDNELQAKMETENKCYLEETLSFIVDNYLKPKFEDFYEGILLQASCIIHIPPEIPRQMRDSDCGVYLLQFAKHIVFKKNFDFNSEDMEHFRQEMKMEFFTKNLGPVKYGPKIKTTPNIKKNCKTTQKVVLQRRFDNKLLEDCWMNSTLQLILTGLDHLEELTENGSTLWSTLIYLKNQDKQKVLDPLPVKKLLISKENARLQDDIGSPCMIFQPAVNRVPNHLLQIGQQDAKDFFICLYQNQNHWPDVFNTFKVRMRSFSQCRRCGHRSSQANFSEFIFLEFDCPGSGSKMSTFMNERMEQPEIIPEWRDEEGCGQQSEALNYSKIDNIDETEFIIIVLRRLVNFGNGPTILRNNVILDKEVQLTDLQNRNSTFKPLAVIFHIGNVQGQDAYGHYKADVRNLDGNWYRTSDDMMPQKIEDDEVSDQGYIFLYQKVH